MKITLVKKIKADGSECAKCQDVVSRLEQSNHMQSIDEIIIADERDPNSAGMVIAKQHQVSRAPFFLVEEEGKEAQIYTVYFKFVKQVLAGRSNSKDEAQEIMRDNPDLDFI